MIEIFCLYTALNLIGFILIFLDKRAAIHHQWRISEFSLLFIALCGAAFGEYVSMKVFHHKTLKPKFKYGLPILIIINIACYGYLIFLSS